MNSTKTGPDARGAEQDRSEVDLDEILRDLREANANLVLANLRSQALAAELALLYENATEEMQKKDEFFEQVSHELRSPMTSITGWASLMEVDPAPATIREAVVSIAMSAAIQSKLVDDILEMSKIMTKRFEINKTEIELRSVVNDAISAIRPSCSAKQITLKFAAGNSILVDGDAVRLRQVLNNLLSNAVKFTQAGGAIETTLTLDAPDAVLSVRDNGEGIPAEFLPQVFARHTQATAGRFGGLGLGLTIARHIVELHGGFVEAQSEGAKLGSTFTIRLPGARLV